MMLFSVPIGIGFDPWNFSFTFTFTFTFTNFLFFPPVPFHLPPVTSLRLAYGSNVAFSLRNNFVGLFVRSTLNTCR